MGWSTSDAKLELGTDNKGFGFGGTGKKSHNGSFDDYGEAFTLNDVIGCFIDLDAGTVHFSKNAKQFPTAFRIPSRDLGTAFYPAVLLKVTIFFRTVRVMVSK